MDYTNDGYMYQDNVSTTIRAVTQYQVHFITDMSFGIRARWGVQGPALESARDDLAGSTHPPTHRIPGQLAVWLLLAFG